MERLGYSVVNVGERDLRLGYSHFAEMSAGRELTFLSANVIRSDGGATVFPASTIVEARSADGSESRRIGLVGVARYNPLFRKEGPDGSQMQIAHPTEPVRAEVARLRTAGVDQVVLLAALHIDDARRIVREVPGIDFALGSYGGLVSSGVEREGETWLFYTGNQGKRVGVTRVQGGAERPVPQTTRIHFLTNVYPTDQPMLDFVNAMPGSPKTTLATVRAGADGESHVGSLICQGCHVAEYEQWQTTAHAHAMKTLEEKEGADLPRCQICHNTGVGRPGGFVSRERTPNLAEVGCESCHGPGRRHIESPATPLGPVDISTCTICHDRQNSPRFDYYRDVNRVRHSGGP